MVNLRSPKMSEEKKRFHIEIKDNKSGEVLLCEDTTTIIGAIFDKENKTNYEARKLIYHHGKNCNAVATQGAATEAAVAVSTYLKNRLKDETNNTEKQ